MTIKKIKKAVFPVAGFGTRFLPATKAMPKELLPIMDKPLIQYAAEEAIAAGIDTLIFVTGRNKRAIEDHFDANIELEAMLINKGKRTQAEMVRNILPKNVDCIFVRQAEQLGLGHAVLCAKRVVGDDPFAVLLADDFIPETANGILSELVQNFEQTRNPQISVMQVNGPEISKYGVVQTNSKKPSVVSGLVEKPPFVSAPSNLASIGRYVLTADIFEILQDLDRGAGGEIQLADAINKKAKLSVVEMVKLKGKRFDCGTVLGYLHAIQDEANRRGLHVKE